MLEEGEREEEDEGERREEEEEDREEEGEVASTLLAPPSLPPSLPPPWQTGAWKTRREDEKRNRGGREGEGEGGD